jgi:hypothetical protein
MGRDLPGRRLLCHRVHVPQVLRGLTAFRVRWLSIDVVDFRLEWIRAVYGSVRNDA